MFFGPSKILPGVLMSIRLVVAQVISHSITGHQGLSSVHAKHTNAISDTYVMSVLYYIGLMVTSRKLSIFSLSPQSLFHSTNTDAWTHSWKQYSPSDLISKMKFCCRIRSKFLPTVYMAHIYYCIYFCMYIPI